MKKIVWPLTFLLLAGCACHRSTNKVALYRQALKDTNAALTEAQDRAAARQEQAERLARKLYGKHKKRSAQS